MNLNQVYTQLATLFLTMLLGYVLGKINVITKKATENFSGFVINEKYAIKNIDNQMFVENDRIQKYNQLFIYYMNRIVFSKLELNEF